MLAFAFRRTLQSFPTVAAVALLVFVLFSVIPGSIATSMSDDGRGAMDAEVVERMRKELGLDDPVHVRFAKYVCETRGPRSRRLVPHARASVATARQAAVADASSSSWPR